MLGDPDAAIAPVLGVNGEIAGIVERAARVRFLGHADEVEDGQRRHGILPEEALKQFGAIGGSQPRNRRKADTFHLP